MNNDQAATILEQAADLLETEKIGWCQNTYSNNEPCKLNKSGYGSWNKVCPEHKVKGLHYTDTVISACAVGALMVVAGVPMASYFEEEGQELRSMVRTIELSESNDLTYEIEGWNDDEGRTKEEVIDLFKNSAKAFRNGELTLG